MTQAPEKGEEPCLPHGLSMLNTYTEKTTGSKHVTIVIKNPNSCTNCYLQGHQCHLGGSCEKGTSCEGYIWNTGEVG